MNKIYQFLVWLILVLFFINISRELVFAIGTIFCIYALVDSKRLRKSDNSYFVWLLLFFSFCIISCMWAIKSNVAMWVIIIQQYPIYCFCMSVYLKIKTIDDFKKILRVFFYATLALLLFVVVNVDVSQLESSRLASSDDPENALWNPNYLGLYFSLACYAGYFSIFREKTFGALHKFFYVVCVLCMIILILLSGSRSALLSLMIPLIVKNMYGGTNYIKKILIVCLILTIFYVLIMYVPILYNNIGVRLEEMFVILNGGDNSDGDDSRKVLIISGLMWFLEAPFFGIGINNFRVLSGQRLWYATAFYAHNNYVELLVDIGIIGMLLYYTVYLQLFRKVNQVKLQDKQWMVAFICMLLFTDISHVSYYEVSLQLTIALLFAYANIFPNKTLLK